MRSNESEKMRLYTWEYHVSAGSSPVDWCEPNYATTTSIGIVPKNIKNINHHPE